MDWTTVFNSTWVTNFWTEFNAVINSWIGYNPGWTQTMGVLVPFVMFLFALEVVRRMILMVRKITSGAASTQGLVEDDAEGTNYRDA